MAAFMIQQQTGGVATETVWPAKLKLFPVALYRTKFADHWHRVENKQKLEKKKKEDRLGWVTKGVPHGGSKCFRGFCGRGEEESKKRWGMKEGEVIDFESKLYLLGMLPGKPGARAIKQ